MLSYLLFSEKTEITKTKRRRKKRRKKGEELKIREAGEAGSRILGPANSLPPYKATCHAAQNAEERSLEAHIQMHTLTITKET